jgi:hypothetical protein
MLSRRLKDTPMVQQAGVVEIPLERRPHHVHQGALPDGLVAAAGRLVLEVRAADLAEAVRMLLGHGTIAPADLLQQAGNYGYSIGVLLLRAPPPGIARRAGACYLEIGRRSDLGPLDLTGAKAIAVWLPHQTSDEFCQLTLWAIDRTAVDGDASALVQDGFEAVHPALLSDGLRLIVEDWRRWSGQRDLPPPADRDAVVLRDRVAAHGLQPPVLHAIARDPQRCRRIPLAAHEAAGEWVSADVLHQGAEVIRTGLPRRIARSGRAGMSEQIFLPFASDGRQVDEVLSVTAERRYVPADFAPPASRD